MGSDPTLDLLTRLRNPKLWIVKRDIPVFRVHARRDKKGGEIKVDVARLHKIVANTAALRDEGVVPRVTIGHIKDDLPDNDRHQPPLVGFADNWRMGVFGPKKRPSILTDFLFFPDARDTVFTPDGRWLYPYRSAEFFPPRDEITGVALLLRDPELDLGVMLYDRGDVVCYERSGTVTYSFGGPAMPMPTQDPTTPPTATPPATPPDQDFDSKVHGAMDKHPVVRYAKKCYEADPGYAEFLKGDVDQGKPDGGPGDTPPPDKGDGGDPSGGGNAAPPPMKKPDDKEMFQRDLRVNRLEAEVQEMRLARAEEAKKYARTDAERIVGQLQANGVSLENPQDEINELAALKTDAERIALAKKIVKYSRGSITNGQLQNIANLDGSKPGEVKEDAGSLSEARQEQCFEYMRQHPDSSWGEAVAKTKAGAK